MVYVYGFIIILYIVFLYCIFLDYFRGSWETHKKMTMQNTPVWGYGDFKKFQEEFNRRSWLRDNKFPESFFTADYKSRIHASIVEFDGKGMVLDYKSYRKLEKMLKENKLNELTNFQKDLWS